MQRYHKKVDSVVDPGDSLLEAFENNGRQTLLYDRVRNQSNVACHSCGSSRSNGIPTSCLGLAASLSANFEIATRASAHLVLLPAPSNIHRGQLNLFEYVSCVANFSFQRFKANQPARERSWIKNKLSLSPVRN